MRKFTTGAEYLCRIGDPKRGEKGYPEVGIWDGDSFGFSNGLGSRVYFRYYTDKRSNGSNANYVLSARKL